MQPSNQLYQNRHIFQQLGMVLWVDKNRPITQLIPWQERSDLSQNLPQSSSQNLAAFDTLANGDINGNTNNNLTKAVLEPNLPDLSTPLKQVPNLATSPEIQPKSSLPPVRTPKQALDYLLNQQKPSESANTEQTDENLSNTTDGQRAADGELELNFHLQAVIYQNWLLLVDLDTLEMAGRELWLSLQNALFNQASQVSQANPKSQAKFITKQLDYPIFANDPSSRLVSVANASFKGFIFSCLRESNTLKNIALLTDLPDYLNPELPALQLHDEHRIDKMLLDKMAKKAFWQQLHS
ncbi:hypothetical protein ACFBZI_07240 [Moraxella sp. ZJ142]|uniref:hypothetical protein n=1 Tax=Moraxella marmotae TaxID=3344520 RepID=UPI0035D482A8